MFLKKLAVVALLLTLGYIFGVALNELNKPSTMHFGMGILLIAAIIFGAPALIRYTWKGKGNA